MLSAWHTPLSNREGQNVFKDSLWVALGAVLGANLRYGVGRFVGRAIPVDFPFGTLLINITGSFILGVFFMWARQHEYVSANWRLVVAVGFCGGFGKGPQTYEGGGGRRRRHCASGGGHAVQQHWVVVCGGPNGPESEGV